MAGLKCWWKKDVATRDLISYAVGVSREQENASSAVEQRCCCNSITLHCTLLAMLICYCPELKCWSEVFVCREVNMHKGNKQARKEHGEAWVYTRKL